MSAGLRVSTGSHLPPRLPALAYSVTVTAEDRLAISVTQALAELNDQRCTCPDIGTANPSCWFEMTPAKRAEVQAQVALRAVLGHPDVLSVLADWTGATRLYRDVRKLLENTLCGNCGCPVENGEAHYAQGMGYCFIGEVT